MTESPPVPPRRTTPPPFLRGFNVEDLILNVFSLLTLLVFATFFYQHHATTCSRSRR